MKPVDGKPAAAPCPPPLLQLLDRPIAFHRCFVTLTGSVTAALMLSQALYWQRRCKEPEGWWYKTLEEWTEETGLNRRETEAARIKLRALEVLEEKRTGSPAKLWYRIDLNTLEQALCGVTQPVTMAEILSTCRRGLMRPALLSRSFEKLSRRHMRVTFELISLHPWFLWASGVFLVLFQVDIGGDVEKDNAQFRRADFSKKLYEK